MKIANPLYDKAFKYLMQNEKYAAKVLSVILDREVLSVSLSQQETTYVDEQQKLSLFILDFKAEIRDANGEVSTVLIELQKSKFTDDIRRFRNYLGSQYLSHASKQEDSTPPLFPIITVYILGYPLEGNPYLAIKSGQVLTDATTNRPVDVEDHFLKYLTHESYLIQVVRLPEERRTRLERFFMLFNQAWVSGENYILDLAEVPEEFSDVATYLSGPLQDQAFRRQLQLEDEVTHRMELWEKQLEEARATAKKERKEKEQAQAREEIERKQKEQAQTAAKEAQTMAHQLVRAMAQTHSPEEIAQMVQLPLRKVKEIIGS